MFLRSGGAPGRYREYWKKLFFQYLRKRPGAPADLKKHQYYVSKRTLFRLLHFALSLAAVGGFKCLLGLFKMRFYRTNYAIVKIHSYNEGFLGTVWIIACRVDNS